jgi:hypothetical protein
MSRTIHSYAIRMLAVAGFLGVATLVAPAATHAQTISPGRALLNTTSIVSHGGVTVAPAPARTVDGEWALLGRSTAGVSSQPTLASGSLRDAGPVDSEQALLGKVAPSETRRLMLAL